MEEESILIKYLDKRLDRLEEKVDKLWGFRWFILGAAAVVGWALNFMINILK